MLSGLTFQVQGLGFQVANCWARGLLCDLGLRIRSPSAITLRMPLSKPCPPNVAWLSSSARLENIDPWQRQKCHTLRTLGGTPNRDPCSLWGLIWGPPRDIGVI